MYKSVYGWHKWIGLSISVPVVLWALSGLLHPTLRLTKPVLETHKIAQQALNPVSFIHEPQAVLTAHDIRHVKNIRIVSMHERHFYRINIADGGVAYFDTVTAERLAHGEQQYAEYLARHYLGDQVTAITAIEPVKQFSDEYAPINRFLPVWRVDFARDDGLRLYVDTESSRLATAVDNLRADLLWWFGILHDWSFLDQGNVLRIGLFLLAMLSMFAVGVMGIVLYGLRYQCMSKAVSVQARSGPAYFHRTVGVLISLSTLMFSFSGALHVWHKLNPDDRHSRFVEDLFAVDELAVGIVQAIQSALQQGPVKAISLVRVGNEPYYRLVHGKNTQGDMKHSGHANVAKAPASWPSISYVNTRNGEVLENAEKLYARQLAGRISGHDTAMIIATQPVTSFTHEYGFIDRRLPVIQVNYDADGEPAYYVDPSTGRLAAMVDDGRRFEKFTFRMFHKWRFADGLGKNGRDAVIAGFILLNVLVIVLGVLLFVSRRRRSGQ